MVGTAVTRLGKVALIKSPTDFSFWPHWLILQ